MALGCAKAASGLECQLENRGHQWFEGLSYTECMRLREEERHAHDALARDEAACDRGDAQVCLEAGRVNQETDTATAIEQFDDACDAGVADGCAAAREL